MPILTSRLRSPHQRRADNLTILRRTAALPTTSGRFTKTFTSAVIPQFDPTCDSDAETDGPHSQLSSSNLLRELSRKSTSSIPNDGVVGERVENAGAGADCDGDLGKENWEAKGMGCFERDRMGSFIRKDVGGKIVADFEMDGILTNMQLKEILDEDYELFHNAREAKNEAEGEGEGEGEGEVKEAGDSKKEVEVKEVKAVKEAKESEKEKNTEGEEVEKDSELANEKLLNLGREGGTVLVKEVKKKKAPRDGTLRKAKSHPIPSLVTSQASSTSNASTCRQSAPALRSANTLNTFTISRHHDLCTLFILNAASTPIQGKGKHKSKSSIPLFVEQCGQLPTEAWVNGNLHAVHAKSCPHPSDRKKGYEAISCLPWQWWGKVKKKKKHSRKRKRI